MGQKTNPIGFRDGVVGMRVGGRRTITIPPNFAFGSTGIPGLIPPCETLTFDVRLIRVLTD
jgi:FKBP-type peptidyl-prolyl cis-trans isomerase FkpA